MAKIFKYRIARLIVFAVLVLLGLPGCSARHKTSDLPAAAPRTNSPLEIECERELLYLDALIETKRMDRRLRAEVMAEAIELRRAAGELFINGEFELALELIEEAVSLLKESG